MTTFVPVVSRWCHMDTILAGDYGEISGLTVQNIAFFGVFTLFSEYFYIFKSVRMTKIEKSES